jgi:hypothetical protein
LSAVSVSKEETVSVLSISGLRARCGAPPPRVVRAALGCAVVSSPREGVLPDAAKTCLRADGSTIRVGAERLDFLCPRGCPSPDGQRGRKEVRRARRTPVMLPLGGHAVNLRGNGKGNPMQL